MNEVSYFRTRMRRSFANMQEWQLQAMKERGVAKEDRINFTLDYLCWKMYEAIGTACYWCGQKMKIDNIVADHMIPIARGGAFAWHNIRGICRGCNKFKGSMLESEFAHVMACRERMSRDVWNQFRLSAISGASFRHGANRRGKNARA